MNHAFPQGYGWLMLLGLAVSIVFWARLAKRDERLVVIYVGALFGAFAGAKIVYFFAEGWLHLGKNDFWEQLLTGKTILGALLGGYVAVELAKWATGYRSPTGDWFAIIAPIGISFGRIGCLLHGCCLGKECDPGSFIAMTDSAGVPRWPSAAAELSFNVAAIPVFMLLRKNQVMPNQHFHLYLIAYGLFRFIHEPLRLTPKLFGAFSGYQIAALLVFILGLGGFLLRAKKVADGARIKLIDLNNESRTT